MIFLKLFLVFLKIGAFTFGGGYAMLPFINEEVLSNEWMKMEEMVDFIAVSESTPGPFAVNMATFTGNHCGSVYSVMGGVFGAFCATLGVVLPSFIIILIVAKFYQKYKNSTIVSGCMAGLKPAVVGLIGAAVLSVGIAVFVPTGFSIAIFKSIDFYVSAGIFIGALVLTLKKVHPIIVICLSAIAGIAVGYLL